MNYRHIFHAGNICDVVKHAVLAVLIGYLREKDRPFYLLDTHAGGGLYDLQDARARKTGEAQDGIFRLLAAPFLPELAGYYAALQRFNPEWRLGDPAISSSFRFYPGSPFLAASLSRPQDRVAACELHEEDAGILKSQTRIFGNIQIHHRDGYEAVRALLPPTEKRGLVMIDPPFEETDEFERLTRAVALVHGRWSQGLMLVWYPVKDRPALWRFHESLIATGIPRQLCAEFIYEEESRYDRLNGCGFILVNPPWRFDEKLQGFFAKLHEALQTTYRGVNISWLTGEENGAAG